VAYTYDNLDRVTEVKASKDGTSYTIGRYIYDKLGRVARFVDGQVSGKSCTYGYDLTDRLCEAVFDDGTAYRYTYDANDCLVKEVQTTPDGVRTVTRGYDADSRETSVACGSARIENTFDKLGRLSSIKRNSGKHTTVFQYMKAPDGGETGRVASIKNGSDVISYGYDKRGYVTSATNGSTAWKYHYDAGGQLIQEENPVQQKTFVYQYDEGGNLLEVKSYPMTDSAELEGSGTVEKTFTYGSTWKDQLAAVTMDGKTRTFTYDANGNMISDGKDTYSWTKGSLLEKVTGDGLEAVYTYDASGIRTSKKVNGTTTEYLIAGGSVLGEKKNGVWQYYLYDGDGQLSAISYKGGDYYYIRDNLRTITGLVDANGAAVVNYRYDSWGRMLDITGSMAETLGKDNPYRYKGYCYDEETGMYYLKSRYYAPEICRFISADDISAMLDSPMSLWDKNLYVYCDNDPVNKKDDDGEIANFVAMGLLGAVVNVGVSFVVAKATGQDYGWRDVVIDATVGALTAIVPATKIGKVAKEVIKKGISMAGELVRTGLTKETVESIALSFFTPDVAKYGKLDFLNEKILKDKIQLTIINTPFEMAYSLVTSAGRQAQKSSRKTSSGRRTKTNNGYKVLRNRLVKRGRIAYHEMQYMYGGRIYYNRVYM
jgi:RHS repeat-associated protein